MFPFCSFTRWPLFDSRHLRSDRKQGERKKWGDIKQVHIWNQTKDVVIIVYGMFNNH